VRKVVKVVVIQIVMVKLEAACFVSKVSSNRNHVMHLICSLAATKSQIPVPNCESEGYLKYVFLVRAVNVGTNNVTHYGKWSSPGETNCYRSGNNIPVIILPWSQGLGVRKEGIIEDFKLRMVMEATQEASMEVPYGFQIDIDIETEGPGLLQELRKDIDFDGYCRTRKAAYSKQEVKTMYKRILLYVKYVRCSK